MSKQKVVVIGGGLAGTEAALRLLDEGFAVEMFEMRPKRLTGAHDGGGLAELVCSNSLKSTQPETASGLLKEELDLLGSRLLPLARECAVPSGSALAVDREQFSLAVERALCGHDDFILHKNEEVTSLEDVAEYTGLSKFYIEELLTKIEKKKSLVYDDFPGKKIGTLTVGYGHTGRLLGKYYRNENNFAVRFNYLS